MSERPKTIRSAVRKSKSWREAEFEYESMCAMSLFPMMGERLTADKIDQLKALARLCPRFYPAVLELGLHRLARGEGRSAEQQVRKGIDLMMELAEPKHLAEEISATIDNLEKLWRYDLCRQVLEPMVKRRPNDAELRDSLACALAQLGEREAAVAQIGKALEISPENPFLLSNRGWILLMAGRLEEAGKSLRGALRVSPDHVAARGNLNCYRYLLKHGCTYLDFLLRPANRKRIDQLSSEERWDESDELSHDINSTRMEAFALSLLRRGGRSRANIHDRLSTLTNFFSFVRKLALGLFPLDEDVRYVEDHLEPILHKFILEFGDADSEILESITDATCAYYEFLESRGLVSASDLSSFRTRIRETIPGIIEKSERYKAVRHDPALDENAKEDVRAQLFGADHLWPCL